MFRTNAVGITEADLKAIEEINLWLAEIKKLRILEVRVEGNLAKSKIAWKATNLLQSYIYRIYEIAENCSELWSSQNYLASLILARSLLETGVSFWQFDDDIELGINKADLNFLDSIITKQTFSNRLNGLFDNKNYEAKNILSLIDKRDKTVTGIRNIYDILSEYSHPNYYGHSAHYSNLDTSNGTVTYSNGQLIEGKIHQVIYVFLILGIVINGYNRIKENIEKISNLQHTINPIK